ncbi:hypothetical protein AcV5_009721 [Taiwanofungus camphoratus]|nr:hypothetical protein AcV5_009721 [Antrodia cinnamomea]
MFELALGYATHVVTFESSALLGMDTADTGRYGTLALLKRLEPDTVVAAYPVDEPEVTIGRDPSCSIRLYYPAVSALHCKIVFNENKAFLIVLGTNGVLIDDIPVFPAPPSSSPTTVPLPSGSTLDIHKKRFRFAAPPKHLRPALAALPATPQTQRRRGLRLSMIRSAHVFSPRPSADPRENLRLLQSPLKTPFRARNGTLENDEDGEIVLVESNHPRVVEEEKDLVILDTVTLPEEPAPPPVMPVPQQAWCPPTTPARRPPPRTSLHRAVLMRSAHRAAMRQEMAWEEEMEVEEVEESIIGPGSEESGEEDGIEEDVVKRGEGEEKTEVREARRTTMSGWRRSLEAVKEWALRGSSVETEAKPTQEHVHEDGNKDDHEDPPDEYDEENKHMYQHEQHEESDGTPAQAPERPTTPPLPPARPLGRFMTPQAPTAFHRPSAHIRYSVGGFMPGGVGTGPRRVRVVAPWKVTDLVVPLNGSGVKEEEETGEVDAAKEKEVIPGSEGTPARRQRLSEEERQAIRERRRSALATPDTFFPGRVHTPSAAPLPALFASTPGAPPPTPFDGQPKEEEGNEDTQVLLARMQQMVEGVKRRQSMGMEMGRRMSLSPRKKASFSLLARDGGEDLIEEAEGHDDKENAVGTGEHEQESIEIANPEVSADPLRQPPQTPRLDDLRHMFAAPRTAQTPSFRGVREMFLREQAHEKKEKADKQGDEEALEGVGEMLATPAGWRGRPAAVHPEADAEDEEHEEHAPTPPSAPARATKGRSAGAPRRTPRTAETPKETGPQDLATVHEDEDDVTNSETHPETHPETKGARIVRRTRTRTAESDQDSAGIPRSTRTATRKGRVGDEHGVAEPAARTRSTKKRAGAGTDVSEDEAGQAVAKTVRRTRKAAEPSTSSPIEDVPAPATKTLRRTRVTRTPAPEEPSSALSTAKSSTGRRGTKTQPIAVDEQDDPLDSINPEAMPAASRVRRTARSRMPSGTIKEEEDTPTIPQPEEGEVARTARGRKTPTTTTKAGATKTVARTRAEAASAKKTAAPEPPSGSTSEEVGDKENTPEPQEEEQPVAATKAKASAAKTAPRTASKVTRSATKARDDMEEPTAETEVGRSGARAGRTRVGAGRK